MKIYELFETKTAATGKKLVVPASKPRNPFGKQPKTSGAGSHTPSKYTRHSKHKDKDQD